MQSLTARAIIETTAFYLAFGILLLAAAGNPHWPQAWIFLAESELSALALILWLGQADPALLTSRMGMRWHRDQAGWDQFFLAAALPVYPLWLLLIALDAQRFGWSHVPIPAQISGAVLIAVCMAMVQQVFAVNSFAAPQVRIQAGRGQHVVTTGPYRFVRHPMYAAALLYFLGTPLLLGSYWGMLPVPLFIAGLGARAAGEERLLRRSLPGYDDYARQVRFRLIPFVW